VEILAFILRQLIEEKKERNLPTRIELLDYEKEFDRGLVCCQKLCNILMEKEVCAYLLKTTKSLYVSHSSMFADN
jgi:hypothetical protein